MIAQPPHGLNAHVRADGRKLFAQEADVDKMASLDTFCPFVCKRYRITSNSRADSRSCRCPQISVPDARSSVVLPNESALTSVPCRRSSAPTQASSSRASKGFVR